MELLRSNASRVTELSVSNLNKSSGMRWLQLQHVEAHFAVNFRMRSFWARMLLSCSNLEDLIDFNSEFKRRISISSERGSPPPPVHNGA